MVNAKRAVKELELGYQIPGKFSSGGYWYARTANKGYRKYLITREHPRGRPKGASISQKEFISAWKKASKL